MIYSIYADTYHVAASPQTPDCGRQSFVVPPKLLSSILSIQLMGKDEMVAKCGGNAHEELSEAAKSSDDVLHFAFAAASRPDEGAVGYSVC